MIPRQENFHLYYPLIKWPLIVLLYVIAKSCWDHLRSWYLRAISQKRSVFSFSLEKFSHVIFFNCRAIWQWGVIQFIGWPRNIKHIFLVRKVCLYSRPNVDVYCHQSKCIVLIMWWGFFFVCLFNHCNAYAYTRACGFERKVFVVY